MQDALHALVVLEACVLPQLPQHATAVSAQFHELGDVVACPRGCAFAQEPQAPGPLARISAQSKQQRRVFPGQPLEHLQRRCRIGPGLGVAYRDLSAVGITGFSRRQGLPVNHGDFMAELGEVPG